MRAERLGLLTALAASLLLNLFVGGVVAGRWLAPRPQAPGGALAPMRNVRLLPPAERALFSAAMRERRQDIRAARQQVRAARARVADDIAAPAYDKAQVQADFAALRQATMALQEKSQSALADALQTLSPASRAAVVARAREASTDSPSAAVGSASPAR